MMWTVGAERCDSDNSVILQSYIGCEMVVLSHFTLDVVRTAPSNPISVKVKLSAVKVFGSSPDLPQDKTVH